MGKDQYLAGQVAIVTGGSKITGIGAACAIALAEHGANVLYPAHMMHRDNHANFELLC